MRNTKKGFTLVELLVVIAILAILATVSVVGYTSFIKRANVSNDQAMIGMINNNLQAASVNNRPKTAGDAIALLAGCGFYGDKFDTYSTGYHYGYHLENNKFYLIDNNGKVIYPDDGVELSSIWALYGDSSSDYISGVTKYVATTTLQDKVAFDNVFTGSGYEIDLNSNLMVIDANNKSGITLYNGTVTVEGYANSEDDSAAKVMEYYDFSKIVPDGKTYFLPEGVIENVILKIDGEEMKIGMKGTTTIRNCVILNSIYSDRSNVNLTIENCVFVNIISDIGVYCIQMHASEGTVNISGNTFSNCQRAVLLTPEAMPESDRLKNLTVNVENNVFNLLNDIKNNAAVRTTDLKDSTKLTVKNNTINGGDMLIRGKKADALMISYSGNTLINGIPETAFE